KVPLPDEHPGLGIEGGKVAACGTSNIRWAVDGVYVEVSPLRTEGDRSIIRTALGARRANLILAGWSKHLHQFEVCQSLGRNVHRKDWRDRHHRLSIRG